MMRWAILLAATCGALFAQESKTLEALLAEVRQLRIALERSAVTVPRMQVAVQRMQMQQARVDALGVRLQGVRSKLTASTGESARAAEVLHKYEAEAAAAQDPQKRREFQQGIEMVRFNIQQSAARDAQQRAEEIELASAMRAEQAKLDDLTRQFDALEASLMGGK